MILSDIQKRYQKIAGSAVNPVLREGNSDRRVAAPVKAYAQKNPHRMGLWSKASRTHVAHMSYGDFYESEQSVIMEKDTSVEIVLVDASGAEKVLKKEEPLLAKEVIDSSFMSVKALQEFPVVLVLRNGRSMNSIQAWESARSKDPGTP